MFVIERLIAATALFVAAHFAMGFLNPSAGGSGGALIFPFASNAGSRWAFGALDGGPFVLLIPLMIGLAGIAVLAFFLGVLATFGLLVPTNLWRPLVVIAVWLAVLGAGRAGDETVDRRPHCSVLLITRDHFDLAFLGLHE